MAHPGRLALLLVVALLTAAVVSAQSEPVETQEGGKTYLSAGTYNRDVTFSRAKSPYVIFGAITFLDGRSLTIEPGVSLEFQDGMLYLNGRLQAQGTESERISFTAGGSSQNTCVRRVWLLDGGADSVLSWTLFNNVGLIFDQSGLTVSDSEFRTCSSGIDTVPYSGTPDGIDSAGNPVLRRWDHALDNINLLRNVFTVGNSQQPAIRVIDASRATIADNTVTGSWLWGIYVQSYRQDVRDITVQRNIIHDRAGAAIRLQHSGLAPAGNASMGPRAFEVTVRNNLLVNNDNDIILYSFPERIPEIRRNTFGGSTFVKLQWVNASATADLSENFWGTTSITLIRSQIYDGGKVPSLPVVQLEPILTASDSDTPTLQGTLCTDDCASGGRECSGMGYRTCGNFDTDACLEWSSVTACSTGEQCTSGVCSALPPPPPPTNLTCADECASGTLACSGSGHITCGSFDDDACLEWSAVNPCVAGDVCDAGACVTPPEIPPCVDECTSGPNTCWREGFRGCGNLDDDPCLEWSTVTNCPAGERCADGACAPLPPPEERCVTLCHLPRGGPTYGTICVPPSALPAHYEHGDYLGECVRPDEKEQEREIRNIIEKLEARRPQEISILRPDMPLEKVTIEVDEEFTRVELVFRNSERPPAGTPEPQRKVRRYIEVDHPEIANERVTSAKLTFKVERAWLQEQGASRQDVVLTRFADGAWQDLPTTHVRSDESFDHFEADSAGLSVFAITVRATEAPITESGETSSPIDLASPRPSLRGALGIVAALAVGGVLGAALFSKRGRKNAKTGRPTPSNSLTQYVQSCRAKGYSEEKIHDVLVKAGWDASQVREALRRS